MGYGIVLWLDDEAVRNELETRPDVEVASELVRELATVVGADTYPVPGLPSLRAGHWQRLGSWHTTDLVGLEVSRTGGRLLGPGEALPPAPGGVWQPQLSFGEVARRTREALRHPAALERALARNGGDKRAAICGPNLVRGRSLASLWWLYADALRSGSPSNGTSEDEELGAKILQAIDTHVEGAISLRTYSNALNKAGALLLDERAGLVWSGARICTPSELTERELPLYERRFARSAH